MYNCVYENCTHQSNCYYIIKPKNVMSLIIKYYLLLLIISVIFTTIFKKIYNNNHMVNNYQKSREDEDFTLNEDFIEAIKRRRESLRSFKNSN